MPTNHPQFKSHLEFINHITCSSCKHYWTFATMEPKFEISRGEWFCPNCGQRGAVHQEDHRISLAAKENFFSCTEGSRARQLDESETTIAEEETSTDWFPDLPLSLRSVAVQPNLCLCEDAPEGKKCDCDEFD